MRKIRYSGRFKRDYRREKSGVLGKKLDDLLRETLEFLVIDTPLSARYVDHALAGEWNDRRDSHIRPDLILITVSPTLKASNWCASARAANWVCRGILAFEAISMAT